MTTSKEREAAEAKAAADKAAAAKLGTAHQTTTAAGARHSSDVDEANRKAKEESDQKTEEAQKREAEASAKLQSSMPGVSGPDQTGRADGAANYDRPELKPQPGTAEFHLAHPGEITSTSFMPREESIESFHEKRSVQADADKEADAKNTAVESKTAKK